MLPNMNTALKHHTRLASKTYALGKGTWRATSLLSLSFSSTPLSFRISDACCVYSAEGHSWHRDLLCAAAAPQLCSKCAMPLDQMVTSQAKVKVSCSAHGSCSCTRGFELKTSIGAHLLPRALDFSLPWTLFACLNCWHLVFCRRVESFPSSLLLDLRMPCFMQQTQANTFCDSA
jgi:hypothetical protein